MKFIPRHNQAIGRIVIKRMLESIVRPNETKDTTKFILIDAVGPGAEAAGIKKGDVVLPVAMGVIMLDGQVSIRPTVEEDKIGFFVVDVGPEDLAIQTENGRDYVPFNDPRAAKPLGASAPTVPEAQRQRASRGGSSVAHPGDQA